MHTVSITVISSSLEATQQCGNTEASAHSWAELTTFLFCRMKNYCTIR